MEVVSFDKFRKNSRATNTALKELETKHKLVIFKGSRDAEFSSGSDLKEVTEMSAEVIKSRFSFEYHNLHLIATYNIPTVSILTGLTTCSTALGAKYRIATKKAVFTARGPEVGFFTDAGASFYLSRLKNHFGMYLALTGAAIKAAELQQVGLASHFVENKSYQDLEETLVLCDTDDQVEEVLEEFAPASMSGQMEFDESADRVNKCFSGLTVEQILDNLKADGSDWAMDAIKRLRAMSPVCLKVCHRLLSVGRHMSLEDCAKLEWRLAMQLAANIDFDSNWSSTIEDFSDGELAKFFGPLPDGDELKFEVKRCTKGFHVE